MMSSVVGADKGQAGARDGLDSSQQRRLFDSFSKNILKPFRAVGAALKQSFAVPKQPTQAQVERPPDNLITPPAIPSIQSSGARRTYQRSRSSLRLPSISRSPTAPVDSEPKPIIAARAKDVIAVGRWPAQRRLPGWLKPNDPKNKPWHKYLLKKRQEYLAKSDSESDAGSQTDTDTSPVSQAGAASFTGPLGRNKPLPPVPLPPVKAGPPSTSPSPNVQSRPARTRTPSEISFTSCEMFCMWLWRSEPSWREKYLSRA
ncbi:hypothetical protein PAXINDRAFT_183140 [Paxillus involutus ATCC 200175]|uniref:Uncharacterized protein n=1 Tax=Paxillus involutus ATCC 200175 TaxID=664439 RepID=A0A0C9SLJ0_PAXIN|nr:hypothetical protein PAXINDRAFT_183140 [Paxillus involutus ATCC 200175]